MLGAVYVIASPPSLDLAAQLFRAKLFASQGFGLWNNWWYGGHYPLAYSVLFPPLAAPLGPQLPAALAATGTAASFQSLVRARFGARSWLAATWFGAATATNLFAGRLAFAFGLLPAVACALALQRRRAGLATGLAAISAMCSPVAALFAAVAGAAHAGSALIETRRVAPTLRGLAVVAGALLPTALLAIVFPEGGSFPFATGTLWPLVIIALGLLVALPRRELTLRAGVLIYLLGLLVAYASTNPVGANAARLGTLLAGPLVALLWWPARRTLVVLAAPALLYIQWQASIRELVSSVKDPSASTSFYQPLLSFLERQRGEPFRVEIPPTQVHWESYVVADHFPIARGWERQLDIKYDGLFYSGPLTASRYEGWLHQLAVRFVGLPDAPLDPSAKAEAALIDRGLPYLKLVDRTRHWRVYEVLAATPIVSGPAVLDSIGPGSLTLTARRPGTVNIRVRFTPYWSLSEGHGCVSDDGGFTELTLREAGPARLVTSFSLARIGATSPRCS